jgi:magnesium transporter
MRIQKSLVYFVTALRSNELLMMKMARTNFLGMNEEEKDLLDDLIIETSQALETANTYTTILISTLDAFASIISNNQNEVLKRLSTLTIYLSIPILIASIYGMNVPLPYNDSHYAFWIPVSISAIILAFAIYKFLRRSKKNSHV